MTHRFNPRSTLILRNPASGRATSRLRATRLEARLRDRGFVVQHTAGPGHAGELALRHCRDTEAPALVLIGGDGTLLEAIEHLPASVPIGVYPTGTVNLLARALGIPRDPDAWLALLARGDERTAYFARCNGRPFSCVGSVGLDAETLRHVNPRLKKAVQEAAIGWTAFRHYFTHVAPSYRVEIDGRPVERPLVGVLFALQPYYGGPHRLFPDAAPERAELDVGLLGGSHKRALWRYTAGMLTGHLGDLRDCEIVKARRLRVVAEPPTSVQLDGDYFCETPIDVEVEPVARTILASEPTRLDADASSPSNDGRPSPLQR